MSYRTFFLVRVPSGAGNAATDRHVIDQRVTYEDVSEAFVVEKVTARLDGAKHPTEPQLRAAFPEAVRAASAYIAMQHRARYSAEMKGPFRLHTTRLPTDDDLINWFHRTHSSQGVNQLPEADPLLAALIVERARSPIGPATIERRMSPQTGKGRKARAK